MTREYFLVLGSNRAPARHLRLACVRLRQAFDVRAHAPALRTRAEDGTRYVNAAVRIASSLEPDALRAALHAIEDDAGRMRGSDAVTLDIDLVASRDGEGAVTLHKPDDLRRGYVRALLARIGFEAS